MTVPRGPHPALAAWAALRASGTPRGALVTLLRADGGAARSLGTHLAVSDDGRAFGSVTIGGCADGRALDAARRVIASGRAEQVTLPLSEEDALALGLGCAGDVDLLVQPVALQPADDTARAFDAAADEVSRGSAAVVATRLSGDGGFILLGADAPRATGVMDRGGVQWFAERIEPVHTLLVVGANDIAAALCELAVPLGWRTVLVDARDEVLAQARFAAASERVAAIAHEAVSSRMSAMPNAAVVIVAHDYRLELPVLREALRGAPRYVGMLGSRKRGAAMRAMLADEGLTADDVARLRSPIGLAIGAEGPAEIAVSIAAELVQYWRSAQHA